MGVTAERVNVRGGIQLQQESGNTANVKQISPRPDTRNCLDGEHKDECYYSKSPEFSSGMRSSGNLSSG